jgi:glutamyl-Q tRNA(Asp) synthetase
MYSHWQIMHGKAIMCEMKITGRRNSLSLPNSDISTVIGRFAPSPTGPLHVGSLVAAVGSYALAKKTGGLWLVRIEDLDSPRVVPGMADDMLRTLEILGFRWDGEVIYQSRRGEAYRAALDVLTEKGLVYPCGCSRSEIARLSSAPHPGEEGPAYPGLCRDGLSHGKSERSFRVRVGSDEVIFNDGVMGQFVQRLSVASGDFVVKRGDGPFAYHLAVVVDDAAAGVNQVVRGADLLSSTPRQIYLQMLLGYGTPGYFHLPLVTGRGGMKLSKRDNAVSLVEGRDLAREGWELLIDVLRFLGQEPPAYLTGAPCKEILAWAVAHFDIRNVPRRPEPFLRE